MGHIPYTAEYYVALGTVVGRAVSAWARRHRTKVSRSPPLPLDRTLWGNPLACRDMQPAQLALAVRKSRGGIPDSNRSEIATTLSKGLSRRAPPP